MYEMKPEYYIGIDMIELTWYLEDLREYTVRHFTDEEQYMESINYKKIFTQKIQHQEFIHKLYEFMEHHNDEIENQDEQIMGILKYLTEWLVNHILHVDGQIPKGWCINQSYQHRIKTKGAETCEACDRGRTFLQRFSLI